MEEISAFYYTNEHQIVTMEWGTWPSDGAEPTVKQWNGASIVIPQGGRHELMANSSAKPSAMRYQPNATNVCVSM